jgi:hypothetical protein
MKMTALIVLTAALSAGCATAPSSDWSQTVRSDRGYFGPGAPVQASMWADEGGSAFMIAVEADVAPDPGEGVFTRAGRWVSENPGKATVMSLGGLAAGYLAYDQWIASGGSGGRSSSQVRQDAGGDAITVIGTGNTVTTERPVVVIPAIPPTAPAAAE